MKCLDFFLGFLFIYICLPRRLISNLGNEIKLLASMDIDHPVCNRTNNTVIESEVSEEVSDENTEKQRFASMSTAEITTKAETKNIKMGSPMQVFERKM